MDGAGDDTLQGHTSWFLAATHCKDTPRGFLRPKRTQVDVISKQFVYVYNYDEPDRQYPQQVDLSVNLQLDFAFDLHGNLTCKLSNVSGELNVMGYIYSSSLQSHRPTSVNIGGNVNTLAYSTDGDITQHDVTIGNDTLLK